MKNCPSCKKENPDDFEHCRYCGFPLQNAGSKLPSNFWKRLPSWAWILIIVGGIIGLIALLIGSFVGIATIEGFASLILLGCGIIGFGVYPLRKPEALNPFARGIGLAFFALMGASVDQTGNLVYNKPGEICFCDNGTLLSRDENVLNPMPGTTIIQQDFTCFDKMGNPVKQINMFAVLAIRFIEYVLLGYLLLGVRRLIWNLKNKNT